MTSACFKKLPDREEPKASMSQGQIRTVPSIEVIGMPENRRGHSSG